MPVSGTTTPATEGRFGAAISDPIARAQELLHTAARLPYTASRSRQWSRRFWEKVSAAREALQDHIRRSGQPDSAMSRVERELPQLRAAIERQRIEHQLLERKADALCEEAAAVQAADIWRMVELGEQATLLEMALSRHHNRLVRLVFESARREFTGEAC